MSRRAAPFEMYEMLHTSQRLDRIHRAMQHDEVDLLLVTRPQDIQYITGYQSPKNYLPTACLVPLDDLPRLIISESQMDLFRQEVLVSDIRPYGNEMIETWYPQYSDSFWNHIISEIMDTELQSGMIGLQQDWLSIKEFDRLKSSLPEAGFKDFSQALWKLRQIKDSTEIELISNAVRIAEIGVMTALESISPEKTEIDASIEVESAMRNAGAHLRGIRAAVLSGASARFPFPTPSAQRISDTEPILIDISVNHKGYFAEVARTIHLGTPSAEQSTLFKLNLSIIESIEEHLRPSITIKELAQIALSKVKGRLPSKSILQPFGSSIGLDLREPPYIFPGSQATLRPGMVFSIHPICYNTNVGGTKIADMIFITDDGFSTCNTLARDIV